MNKKGVKVEHLRDSEGQKPSLRPCIFQMNFKHVFCAVSRPVLPSPFILCLFPFFSYEPLDSDHSNDSQRLTLWQKGF